MGRPLTLRANVEEWPLKSSFRISGHEFHIIEVLVVHIERDGCVKGRGEAAGVYYLNESGASMLDQIESQRSTIEAGIGTAELHEVLPPGGARNALDCALWDLKCKSSNKRIWDLIGVEPKPVTTAFTIGLDDTPDGMAAKAAAASTFPILKIKVASDRPVERIAAIRAARPDARLVVDANQGWTFQQLVEVAPLLAEMGVEVIEQPLARGSDEPLEAYVSPIPLCADESCQHRGELKLASRRYQIINVKLDKAGGLTEALLLAREVLGMGLRVVAGSMFGTSLSMAPAFLVAQLSQYAELDGQLLLKSDRSPALCCQNGQLAMPDRRLWG